MHDSSVAIGGGPAAEDACRSISIGRFAFFVPLKPRRTCSDWVGAQANLRRTVASALAAATGQPASVLVVCHDEPDLEGLDSPALHVLRAPFPEPVGLPEAAGDKARKRRFAAAVLRRAMVEDELYAMFLDADDLVHRDLVRYVLDGGKASYLIDEGYVADLAHRVLRHRTLGFSRSCGSSFVCRFTREELPARWDDLDAPFSQFGAPPDKPGHEHYDQVAAGLARPPILVPFPAVVYVVNHGDNLWSSRRDGRLRPIEHPRGIVSSRAARRVLAEEFSAPDIASLLAGQGRIAWARLVGVRMRLGASAAAFAGARLQSRG